MISRLLTATVLVAVLLLWCADPVHGQDDTLRVEIRNVDDGPDRFPGRFGRAILLEAGGDTAGVQSTDSTGLAVFDSLTADSTYRLEAYHDPDARVSAFDKEYWGRRDSMSISDGTTSVTFVRNQPYVRIVKIFVDSTGRYIPPGRTVAPGTRLRLEVTVQNPSERGSSTLPVRPVLLIDQNRASRFDHDLTVDPRSLAAGERHTFEFPVTVSERGPYFVAPAAQVETSTTFMYTDSWNWGDDPRFLVNRGPKAKRGTPLSGVVELSVTDSQEFIVRANDPDGNLDDVEWRMAEPGGDWQPTGQRSGLAQGSAQASYEVQFDSEGEYRVAATVSDRYGETNTVVWTVKVTP